MGIENKKKGILLNEKTLFENIKEFDMDLAQEERVEYMEKFLYRNGVLKEDISCLYDYMNNTATNKKKSPLNTNQIEGFFEILANYILFSPDDNSGLVDKHNVSIIDDKQVISEAALDYVDSNINDIYKNSNAKNEYKDNKIKVDFDDIYNENYVSEKLLSFNIDEKHEKFNTFNSIYTAYHNAVIQLQKSIDHIVFQKIKYIKSYANQYLIVYDKLSNVDKNNKADEMVYALIFVNNNKDTCVLYYNKFMKFVIDRLKLEHRDNGFNSFVYCATNVENITINNYIKVAKKDYPTFEIMGIEYIYKDNINLKKVNNIIKELRQEMVILKKGLLRILNPKQSGSTDYDVDCDVDWLDKEQMNLLLNCHYNKDTYDFAKNADCVLYDFNQIVKDCDFNSDQSKIIELSEKGYKWESKSKKEPTISSTMNKNGLALWQQLKGIVTIIAQKSYDIYEDWYYLHIRKGRYKKCNKCSNIKLVSKFTTHPNTKDGFDCTCKECKRENNKKRKKCKKCGKTKNVSEFGKDNRNKDGLQGYCKKCDRERKKIK